MGNIGYKYYLSVVILSTSLVSQKDCFLR